jgi:hypothetical protein
VWRWEWNCERAASCVALMGCSCSSRTDGCVGWWQRLPAHSPNPNSLFFEVIETAIRQTAEGACSCGWTWQLCWWLAAAKATGVSCGSHGGCAGTCQLDSTPPWITINSPGAHPTPYSAATGHKAQHSTPRYPKHNCTQAAKAAHSVPPTTTGCCLIPISIHMAGRENNRCMSESQATHGCNSAST